jgi:hypothetical protein
VFKGLYLISSLPSAKVENICLPEMTSDSADFLFKDLVVESGFEFSLASGGCRDVHGCLSTTENYEVLFGCDSRAVKRGIGYVGFHDFEIFGVDEL